MVVARGGGVAGGGGGGGSGLGMGGAQFWPSLAARLGGLVWLAPFHTLVAWLFASFVVLHIYLTSTGHTPLANIRAMSVGWEEVAADAPPSSDASARA